MSSTLPTRLHRDSVRVIDMRCGTGTAHISGVAPADSRCQLLAGHHGAHALMFADGTGRAVMVWHGRDEPTVTGTGYEQLPWMRGFPAPAWFQPAA